MIDYPAVMAVAVTFFVALVVPGPDFFLVSRTALVHGWRAAVAAACGIAFGLIFYAGLAVTGLAIILQEMAWLAVFIKVAGGCYLLWLAYHLWRDARRSSATNSADEPYPAISGNNVRASFVAGLMTNLTNPKAIAFFTSIFALAVTDGSSIATKVTLWAMVPLLALAWFSFVAVGLARPRMRAAYEQSKIYIDYAAAGIMATFGIKILLSARG
jgi:threonine efflux protein